jgi:hypothetical protein
MLCGFVAELYIWLFTHVPWTWYVPIGTVITFASGYLVSLLRPQQTATSSASV